MAKAMQRPDIGFERSFSLPAAWRTAPVQLMEAMFTKEMADGHTLLFASGMLMDGTNLFVLSYPGGTKLARSSPDRNWAVEEADRGKPPWERHRADVEAAWGLARQIIDESHAKADEDWQQPAKRREQALDSSLKAVTATMRLVADGFAAGDGHVDKVRDDHMERIKVAISQALIVGATRAEVAGAIAAAKDGRGADSDQAVVLDVLVEMVIDLPEEADRAAS
jgi:hypothetical protein